MKLIDLLVQELPKRGGWPKNANEALDIANVSWGEPPWGCNPMAFCMASHEIVTKEQYEDALAASQRCVHEWIPSEGRTSSGVLCRKCGDYDGPGEDEKMKESNSQVWDGEGLPPVGTICEYQTSSNGNLPVRIECLTQDGVAFTWLGGPDQYKGLDCVSAFYAAKYFKPIRSEADTKRAAVVTALAKAGGDAHFEYGRKTIDGELSSPGWYKLYDIIAAGEIAGIRIE
ncbi:hypothetical protein EHJ06_16700 [Cronobacter malonaticus]|uniref:hypothetical protein n=1 Tax=Cronobacter malonaticus TaxID=413503 RepID=UPI001375E8AC|nr:hypothetical protein [Cronobacter malonaticus]NCH02980.1 hypothetical protein [Cronobacter malonaticus]